MRCCLTFLAVELMRQGYSPQEACKVAISRIQRLHDADPPPIDASNRMHTSPVVGIVAMNKHGQVG